MPLTDRHANTVMFLCHKDLDGTIQPIGTTFMVSAQASTGGWWRYFITAEHLVRGGDRWVRFRRPDGETQDELAGTWEPHHDCDIAACPVDMDTSGFIWDSAETTYFSPWFPGEGASVIRGQSVYFMGLLGSVPTMVDRNIPMMRAGTVGALHQQDIPVEDRLPERTRHLREEPIAHLIDCYSRRGFSGSPLWAEGPRVADGTEYLSVDGYAAFLGVIVGHFGGEGDNAGIAVAVPSEAVRHLLDYPRLVEWRERKDAEMKKKREAEIFENAASLDAAVPQSEYDRFEDLTKKLVQLPKPELDAERKEDEASE